MHMLRSKATLLVAASASLLTAGMTGCAPDASRVTAPAPSAAARNIPTVDNNLALVGRALAAAMQDSAVRLDILQAMRASQLDNHKIDLQTFLSTTAGQRLLGTAVKVAGLSQASVKAALGALSATDFYMPLRRQRQTWRGEAGVMVAAIADKKAPVMAVNGSDAATRITQADLSTVGPILVIEPHEPSGIRVQAQARTPGRVIEDPNDGQSSERFTWTPANGSPTTIDIADPSASAQIAMLEAGLRTGKRVDTTGLVVQPMLCTCEDCPNQDGCQPPPPPAPSDTTLIGSYQMNFCDDDACLTDDEIRITAVYRTSTGTELGRAVYKRGSVSPGTMYTVNAPLIFSRILEGSGQYMLMNLVEEDGFFGGNDDWCGDINVYAGDNGLWANYPNSVEGCANWNYPYSASVRYYWTKKY